MSNWHLRAVRPERLKSPAKAVLLCLADLANESGVCWPSVETLAIHSGFAKSTVMEALKTLEHLGYFFIDRQIGVTNKYQLNEKKLSTALPADGMVVDNVPYRQPDPTIPADTSNHTASRYLSLKSPKKPKRRARTMPGGGEPGAGTPGGGEPAGNQQASHGSFQPWTPPPRPQPANRQRVNSELRSIHDILKSEGRL
jgi:hypothetical protein